MERVHWILDEEGNPKTTHDLMEWAMWMESAQYAKTRQIGCTEFDGYTVSTVYLGMDYSFGGGEPVLWETMVFKDGDSLDKFDMSQSRYHTKEQALAGHEETVTKLKEYIQNGKS